MHTHITHTYTPKPVRENEDVAAILNRSVPTNTEAMTNRPDILIKNEEEKARVLIGVAIPPNINVTQKDAEKIL
jgi:hypothetical protein